MTTFFANVLTSDCLVAKTEEDVHLVWAGHPVGFAMIHNEGALYIAFYDENRNMTLGKKQIADVSGKPLSAEKQIWEFHKLDSKLGWDSHNYITIQFDKENFLHVSGNMHGVPLLYFRAEKPLDITSVIPVNHMVGTAEKRVTYPNFLFDKEKNLIFTYRDGGSGNGSQYWNVYDTKSKTWTRLLDAPLFNGEGKMSAYFTGPTIGPDGYFHLCWMWRDTPDCSTNHDLCYARSNDLRTWEKSDGQQYTLPITFATSEVVDPVPANGGIINPLQRIGFDEQKRVILTHSKYDSDGNFQIINSRREKDGWKHYQTSDWKYRWQFQGGGTIIGEITCSEVTVLPNGFLQQTWKHIKYGSGKWTLDPNTLKPIEEKPVASQSVSGRILPSFIPVKMTVEAETDKKVDTSSDNNAKTTSGTNEANLTMNRQTKSVKVGNVTYTIQWETLPANRDHPREGPPPKPSMMKLITI
ncbi:MAG: BNR repeat-containing protein [Thermoguttaceae bacterium]